MNEVPTMTTKVWAVVLQEEHHHEGTEVLGVYPTQDAAQAAKDEWERQRKGSEAQTRDFRISLICETALLSGRARGDGR